MRLKISRKGMVNRMTKIVRYLKPYIALLGAAVVLLFSQAMLDLSLPNMMSDIVNTGIQKGGITELSPKAISATSMQLMQKFMPESDKALVNAAYEPAGKEALSEADFASAQSQARISCWVETLRESFARIEKTFGLKVEVEYAAEKNDADRNGDVSESEGNTTKYKR